MRAAFHFDAAAYQGSYNLPTGQLFFEAVNLAIPVARRHIRVRSGDLLLHFHGGNTYAETEERARVLLREAEKLWSTLDPETFPRRAGRGNTFVLDVSGLTLVDAQAIDQRLSESDQCGGYLGALQIDSGADYHWAFYGQGLVDAYRIAGEELRLLHQMTAETGDLDEGLRSHWEKSDLFSSVGFEDIGARGTVFDPYDSKEHAERLVELEDLLSVHFSVVVLETILRASDLDPRLTETLHAAFRSADRASTSEDLAQAALSCRRFLERLADALFPPQEEPIDGRELGAAQYRNRLWAYVAKHLAGGNARVVIASLEDVGSRIDRLDSLANSGVHRAAISVAELQRLLIALTALTYDLLTLAPPPRKAGPAPYDEHVLAFLKEALNTEAD